MSTLFHAVRRHLLAPSLREVTFAGRGFPGAARPAAERLEAIPQAVICGFEWGMESGTLWEIERRLDLVDGEQRGFAYEGAAMAFTIRDAMKGGNGNRAQELLLGPGRPHIFLTYIGIGFAMARLPRVLWKKIVPDLSGTPYFPTMSWLAVDGYGFDKAYFDTEKWVVQQRRPQPYPWDGHPRYFLRAFDQGVGRALWFIHGGDPHAVAEAVRGFVPDRQADLWSGVGLAATFAGGSSKAGLEHLRQAAGQHQADLALGVVFAVKARTYAGFVPEHTKLAVAVLAQLTVDQAVVVADSTEVDHDAGDAIPAYELWRRRIRAEFPSQQLRAA